MAVYKPVNITFAYDNLVFDATTITPSTEVPTMPASNLRLQERGAFWRTTDHTSESIILDFTTAKTFKYLALVDHNLTDAATIRIQGNATDSWGSSSYDETFHVDVDSATLTGYTVPVGKIDAPLGFFLNGDGTNYPSYRYVKITFADSGSPGNPDGYIQIGVLWLSDYLESERNYVYGAQDFFIDPSTVTQSAGGQDWPNEETMYMKISFTIGVLSDHARYYHFQQFFFAVRKTRFWILNLQPGTAFGRVALCAYGRFDADTQFTHAFYNNNAAGGLTFKEVL